MSTAATAWDNDRDAIQQLIYRYSITVTRGAFDELIPLFAPDAVWESPLLGLRFETAREFFDFQVEGGRALDVLIQTAMGPVVDLVGTGSAVATTNVREMFRGTTIDDGPYGPAGSAINVDQYAIYFDEVSKIDDVWKFTRRVFVPILVAPGAVLGDITTARPISRPG